MSNNRGLHIQDPAADSGEVCAAELRRVTVRAQGQAHVQWLTRLHHHHFRLVEVRRKRHFSPELPLAGEAEHDPFKAWEERVRAAIKVRSVEARVCCIESG